ncbi:FliH/SctL family protein [Paenibacillus tarimensis]
MISLSNLFKSSHVFSTQDLKRLQLHNRPVKAANVEEPENNAVEPDSETLSLRNQILQDAELFAEQRMKQATEEAERLLKDAKSQIDHWWRQRREDDGLAVETAHKSGFEQGFNEGLEQAETECSERWRALLEEARTILEQAYETREQIIQEAEPFLVELSCAIAEKIIGKQLAMSPDLALDMIRKALTRRREQGVITLCVSPNQLAYVQAAREELSLAIDSQAELQILPDAQVKEYGCVIRSSFGSIDARIDTQLEEIKHELIQIALQDNDRRNADEQPDA